MQVNLNLQQHDRYKHLGFSGKRKEKPAKLKNDFRIYKQNKTNLENRIVTFSCCLGAVMSISVLLAASKKNFLSSDLMKIMRTN